MNLRMLHRFRIAIAAVIGVVVALAAAAGIFLSFKLDPTTLSLSDRIDPARTIVYVSSPDRTVFLSVINRYEEALLRTAPAESEIENADRYEFALLRTGSGETAWAIYLHTIKSGTYTTLVSNSDPTLLLPLSERRQSLGSTSLFSSVPKTQPSFVWFDPKALPLPQTDSAVLFRAALSPYIEGMLVLGTPGRGQLMLRGSTGTQRSNAPDVTQASDPPLLSVSLTDPRTVVSRFGNDVTALNPELNEGITGILKARLKEYTGSTDLEGAAKDLLEGPVALTLTRGKDESLLFTVSGTARNQKVIDTWLQTLSSSMMKGNVRRMEFLKEYARSDIEADPSGGRTFATDYKQWSIQRLGGSGADLSLVSAIAGRRYILGNDEEVVKNMIDAEGTMQSGGLGTGNIDIPGASSEAEARFPFLQPLRGTVEAILGESPLRLTWRIGAAAGGINLDWTLTRVVPPRDLNQRR